MNGHMSLREAFTSSIPQSDADIGEALRTGLLSLDANVLLNFYRYSPNARDALLNVLRAAGDRVWVSHQSAREFWRNRCAAIDDRNQATQQLRSALEKNRNSASAAVDTWVKQTAVPDDVKRSVTDALNEGYDKAEELIEKEIHGAAVVSYDAEKDSILAELMDLLTHHVGRPLPEPDHKEAVAEGARRAKEEIPPGFRDAGKAQSGGPDGPAGDYLVWLQSIHEACRRKIPMVIVTGDEKDDWWWKHRSTLMGPRSELVEEFARHSDKRLYMLRPLQLIKHAAALEVQVSEEAALDVARATTSEPRWTEEAVYELLRRLDRENCEQADVIRFAAEQGGIVDREKIYEIADYSQDRMLRGFTRPTARITRQLQDEGILVEGVEPILTPIYHSGVTAEQFEIPLDVVEILSGSSVQR